MKTLERGFKAWAERASLAFRRELNLSENDPLIPKSLADFLGITLMTPRDVPGITKDVLKQLLEEDPWGWSAVGLQIDGKGIVIYNPRKSPGRQASDITHELAHCILEHQPATIIYSPDLQVGIRSFNQKQEDEANTLAWSLLLPRDALVSAIGRKLSAKQIADQFGVTESLVTFRIGITGVSKQFRSRRFR